MLISIQYHILRVEEELATMSAMHTGPASDDISNVSPSSREQSDAAPSTNIFLTLPSELLRRVVYFLHPNDALILTSSNIFEGRVNVNALHPTPFPSMQVEDRHYPGEIPQPCEPRLQMPCDVSNIHSITLRTQWKDQGWGNRKGGLMIVATPATTTTTATHRATAIADGTRGGTAEEHHPNHESTTAAEDPFDGGLVVAMTDTCAPHEWEQVELTFYPNDRDHYHLWFRVGGGGGHMLSLKDAQVQVFVFDDAQATYQKTYECLYNVGFLNSKTEPRVPRRPPVLPRWAQIPRPFLTQPAFHGKRPNNGIMFYQKLLLGVCRSLLQMKECEHNSASPNSIISPILECLLEHGVPIDKQSVSAIEDFVQTDFNEENTDWEIYEENIQNLRQRHNVDGENNPTQPAGYHIRPGGIPIPLRHATVNGFRVRIPRQHDEPPDPAEHGIRIEPIVPGGNDPMENHAAAALPQVISNPDGTFTINLGQLDDLAAMPLDGADAVHHQNPDRGMEVDPPDVNDNPNDEEMFGIARAAMASVFGFQNDNDGNAGDNNNNMNGGFPIGGFQNFFQQVNGGGGGVVGGGIFVGGGRNDGQFGDGEFQFQNIINLAMNNINNNQQPQPAPTGPVNDQVMTDNENDDVDEDAEEVPFM